MRIEANNSDALRDINDAIHDHWFEVSEVEYDPSSGIVRVPFEREAQRGARGDFGQSVLEVRNVSNCVIEESEGIGRYDFNKLKYTPSADRLTVHTGIPLTFYLEVGSIQVRVHTVADT